MDSLGTDFDTVDFDTVDFDTVLTRGSLVALALAAAWALLLVLAVAVEARSGGRVRLAERAGCPPAVRLWLLGLFVAFFATAAPAQASDPGPHPGPRPHSGATHIGAALDGLPLPDRVAGGPAGPVPSPRTAPTSNTIARTGAGAVVDTVASKVGGTVRAGDCLWRIAAEHLGADATDADVARYVAALYAANRQVIGPDPDLVVPGQQLVFPATITLPEDS